MTPTDLSPLATRPWYRDYYIWLLIAFPLSAVIGGLVTLYFAIASYDGLVVDDYYKHGLEINKTLARDHRANELGLSATTDIDNTRGVIHVRLATTSAYVLPESVVVHLSHATRAGFDRDFELHNTGDGYYRRVIEPLAAGDWYIEIAADEWRLLTRWANR